MDISSLFANSFRPPKFVELSSDVIVPLTFPGGCTVPAVEGRHLSSELSWKDLRADLFLSAEDAMQSLSSISSNIPDLISVSLLVSHSNGKCRLVSIRDEAGLERVLPPRLHTFVPLAVVMGLLLLNLHKFELSKKLRFASLAAQSLEKALEVYPKINREKNFFKDSARSSESGIFADEYEELEHTKCKQCYRMMRYLVPPNIARTDLKKMLSDGIPKSVADRVWSKKALWLLCMHPTDIPKVHIADLRGKYECHGLDIVELRALWHILPRWEGGSPKAEWRRALKARLDELISKEISGKILPHEIRDAAYMGHEKLMIYDPDRILYRQFGVSVTAIGLPPGQRRKRVYTSVDLRVTPNPASSSLSDNASMLSMAIAPPLQSSDTDNNTEGDEEGDLDSAGLPTFDNDCVSSDDDASDEGDSCTGEDSTAVTASPLSGGLEVADDGTDKDTELDDLLNYEIHLSQLDIDMDIADTLSVCSEQLYTSESPIKYDQQTCWKDSKSSGETSYEAHRISDLKGEHKNKSLHEEVGKIDKIPEPRRKLKSTKKGLKTAAKGSSTAMLIENYRPFSFGVPLKKPLKRLNFIGAPGKAPDTDRWLSTLNAPNLRDYDSSLDFFDDDDKEESLFGMGAGSVAPHVFSGSGDKTDSTVAQGSQQIKIPRRRASMPRSSKHTSPLEYMYSHQSGDREHFEFNPLVFPPGSDLVVNALNIRDASASSRLMEAVALVKSKGLESHPSEAAIDYVDNSSAAIVSHSSLEVSCADAPTESCPSTPPIPVIVNDQPTIEITSAVNGLYLSPGDNVLSPAGALTPQDNVNQWRSRSSKKGGVIGKYSDNTKKIQADNSQLNVSLRSVDSVLGKQRSPSISISESSAMSLFSTFSAFSMNSVKSAVHFLFSSAARRDEDKSMDSAAHTGALARDRLIAGQLERERAKERQRKKERELERCEVLNAGTSSPLSEFALDADAQQELCRGVGQEPLTVLDGSHPTDPDMDDLLLLPMRFWNTFPNLIDNSARKGRFISAEEELADNEIESEINNFIVPDELSPIILRQYGIEIGMKELNGIRQNALISLPALLSKIGRKSSEDPMEELTESELGLWGADVEPKMFFTAVAAFNDAGNCELLAGIERLISSDSREDPLKYSPGQKRNRPVRPTSFNAVQIAGMGLQTELEMQQQRRIDDGVGSPLLRKTSYVANSDITELLSRREGAFVLNGESVSEKSFLSKNYRDSSATNEVDFAPFSNRASSVEVQDIEISAPLTPEQAEDLILHKEAHLAWSALSAGSLSVSRDLATLLLLKFAEDPESVVEPLETLVLLVDKLGADVNATNENSMTPLHSLFSKPALGRFILSRGGDVLAKDDHGDSVLAMCAEYGYHWVLPAFMNMHGREAKLLEDPERAHEYAVILISIWGFGTRVKELLEEGVVSISSDEALEIMDTCKENFETMKEPVETFELLETLVLKG